MNSRAFDIATGLGVLMSGVGAGFQWGAAVGVFVGGVTVLAVTLVAALVAGIR
jgi:hypothetical protein